MCWCKLFYREPGLVPLHKICLPWERMCWSKIFYREPGLVHLQSQDLKHVADWMAVEHVVDANCGGEVCCCILWPNLELPYSQKTVNIACICFVLPPTSLDTSGTEENRMQPIVHLVLFCGSSIRGCFTLLFKVGSYPPLKSSNSWHHG